MHDTGCHMDSRHEIFASFPVIFFYYPPLSSSIYFSLRWKGFPGPGMRFDSEVRTVHHDTIFRVKLR